jgi:hypothetical protein
MRRGTLPVALVALFLASCSNPSPGPITVAAGTNTTLTGTVVERLDGAPYSYLRLRTDKGEVWAAVPMDAVGTGKKVTITHGAALKNFQAPRLGRRFDLVVFGTVESEQVMPMGGRAPGSR